MPHEWSCKHIVRHIVVIIPTYALRHVKTAARSRQGNVELTRIFCQEARIVLTVEIGHTPINGIEDDNVVELQPLRLVNCCDEDAFVDATASTEVGFLQRAYLHSMIR